MIIAHLLNWGQQLVIEFMFVHQNIAIWVHFKLGDSNAYTAATNTNTLIIGVVDVLLIRNWYKIGRGRDTLR